MDLSRCGGANKAVCVGWRDDAGHPLVKPPAGWGRYYAPLERLVCETRRKCRRSGPITAQSSRLWNTGCIGGAGRDS